MLIEADDTILEYLKNTCNLNAMDSVIVAINNILNSVLLRQHVFFANLDLLEYLKDSDVINPTNRLIVQFLLDKYSTIGDFFSSIENKIIVRDKNGFTVLDGIYYVDIRDMIYIEKTRLIAEHGSDAEAYIHIGKKIIEWRRYKGFSVGFERKSCYGSNVKDAISSCLLNRPIILSIIDSDKKYFDDDFGSTYRAAKKEVQKLEKCEIIKLYSPCVKEKENLYPYQWYSFVDNNHKKMICVINKMNPSEEFLRFYDIKEGIHVKDFLNADEKWKSLYDEFLNVCEKEKLLKISLADIENKMEDEVIILGIGGEIAEKVDKLFVQGKVEDCLIEKKCLKEKGVNIPHEVIDQYNEAAEISKNIESNLPAWLLIEWKKLGKEILMWGLCFSEEFLPRFL